MQLVYHTIMATMAPQGTRRKQSTTHKMITGYQEKTTDHPSDDYRVPGENNQPPIRWLHGSRRKQSTTHHKSMINLSGDMVDNGQVDIEILRN